MPDDCVSRPDRATITTITARIWCLSVSAGKACKGLTTFPLCWKKHLHRFFFFFNSLVDILPASRSHLPPARIKKCERKSMCGSQQIMAAVIFSFSNNCKTTVKELMYLLQSAFSCLCCLRCAYFMIISKHIFYQAVNNVLFQKPEITFIA